MSELKDGIYEIKLVTRMADDYSGGYDIYGYATLEEMLADHPKAKRFDSTLGRDIPQALTHEERQEILEEQDACENGYLGNLNIQLRMENGQLTLAKPLYFHVGQ